MAITYVGGQSGVYTNSVTPLVVTLALAGGSDGTPQANDLVVVTVIVGSDGRNPALAVTTPAGYTALGQLNQSAAASDVSLNVSYKRLGGTPDTTVTIPPLTTLLDAQAYTIQVFRGVSASTPLDVAAVSAGAIGSKFPDPAAITPVTTGAWVVICAGAGTISSSPYTAPAGYTTNFHTQAAIDTTGAIVGSGYRTWAGGPEDPAAYTGAGTDAGASWAAYTIALRPDDAPIRGAFVAGEHTTVTASRAAAFGLDGNTNTHGESGTLKVFGKIAITGDLEVGGALPAHAATHEAGGVDPMQLDDLAAPSDNTDLNASTTAHGLLLKLSGSDLQVLRGDGTWGMSPLTSGVFAYTFSTTTTEPPGSQRIRFNAGHPYTAVTKLWADFSSSNSEDLYWGWMKIRVGSLIMVQDKDNHLQYAEFTTTGVPIDKGTYVELPVVWASNGTALAVQAALVRATAPAPGGSGIAFGTIQVAGQSDVVADAAPDALTLVAGSGVTLTTNAGTDSITIAATGAAVRRQVTVIIDGGGSVITTGVKTFVSLPVAGTWQKWRLLSIDSAVTSGSIVIDVWKDTYANFPPALADTITASAKPTLSAATKNESSTLTGWTTAFSAGDVLGFNVDSATTVTNVVLLLEFE